VSIPPTEAHDSYEQTLASLAACLHAELTQCEHVRRAKYDLNAAFSFTVPLMFVCSCDINSTAVHINAYQRNQGSLRINMYNLRVPTQNGHRIQKSFEICGIRDSDSNIGNFIILLHQSPLRLQEPTLISRFLCAKLEDFDHGWQRTSSP
jgi:hypothetical protein